MIGRQLGQFRIVEKVGAGGMGEVYRARDERLHRDVALKVLPPGTLSDPSARRVVHREALALSRLNHPAIATVHDFQTLDGMDFIIMEYIPGESLDQRITRGPLPEPQVIDVGLQMAEGLAEAHRQGVIHRDLKPGNLRLTPEGRVKILDFGLAQWLGPDSTTSVTLTSTDSRGVAGTPAYIAPELLRGTPASERSDLYAAGLILYEAATGERPFPNLPVGALLEAVLKGTPPSPRSKNPAISASLESVILHCVEHQPDRRYASARDLADDLKRLAAGSRLPRRFSIPRAATVTLALAAIAVLAAYAAWRWARPAPSAQAASLRSLAVLPLGNLSRDPEQEYFADGMTEELISQLSQVHSIRVISMTSVMRYKKARPSMPEIARQLGVDGVIEGNVIKSHGRLRTTVHLVAAREDEQLWSGRYDGDTTDVLALQSRLARAVVREIQLRLSPEERARIATARRVDPDAYQLYLRARYQWNRRSDAGIRLAIEYFQRAIAADSLYAPAHAGLADAWAAAGLYGLTPPLEARARAFPEAQRAVELEPDLGEAHTSLGHILHNFDWDWEAAEREYTRAIELSPNLAVVHHWRAHLLAQHGDFDAARAELSLARELDPLSVTIVLAGGVVEYYAGRYDVALEYAQRADEIDSTNALIHRLSAAVLDRQGHRREAIRELSRSFQLQGHPEVGAALLKAFDASGVDGALQLLIAGLLRKRASGAYEPAEHIAELYSRLGRKDEALKWLEQGYREHDTELNRLKVDPIFDPLRSDPRFLDLVHRVGLDKPVPRI